MLLVACTSPELPGVAAPTPGAQAVFEDAVPQVYAEEEVDVPARPLEPIRPDYPVRLRELGVEGSVEARVTVWPDGSVRGARLLASSRPEFTDAVRQALDGARFAPGLRRGQPVASTVTLEVHFELSR